MEKVVTAAVIIIGNEILSGRTQDKNINYIATRLTGHGIRLVEARVVPDVEKKIISTLHEIVAQVDYLFTCGGIGPTHDDITAECIAKAFNVPIEVNAEAYAILEKHYGAENFTATRQKMAKIPKGASLILNPVSAAPGFIIGNVHVMAGVPNIMQAMLDNVLANIKGGDLMLSRTVSANLPESRVAEGLETIQKDFPDVEIGSYPYFNIGVFGVSLVLRATNEARLEQAAARVQTLVDQVLAAS
jgi:molybdenum cofactor synthesis domain-containing protein